MKRLRVPKTESLRELLEFARDVGALLEALGDLPILDGRLITGIADAAGNLSNGITLTGGTGLSVPHGLGRAWRGWIVTKVYASGPNVLINADTAGTLHDATRHIHLYSSSTVTVHVWVY